MALSSIAYISINYRDYGTWWLKAYEPGTTTPVSMALDSAGATTVAKLQINVDGFLVSAGDALVIPWIDGAYDLWLFPTEAEADANDTSSALRVADDITAAGGSSGGSTVDDLAVIYVFDTVADMVGSTITFPENKRFITNGYYTVGDNAGASYINTAGSTSYPLSSPSLSVGGYASLELKNKLVDVSLFGAKTDGTNSTPSFEEARDFCQANQKVYAPEGIYHVNLTAWNKPIEGDGSELFSFNTSAPVLSLDSHVDVSTWDYLEIKGIKFNGDNAGDGVNMGLEATNPQLAGRYVFKNCFFYNCFHAVRKLQGNIGNRFEDCTFTSNNYGVRADDSTGLVMHSMADSYQACHFEDHSVACIYYRDGTDGLGQLSFTDCIFENNAGFGIFIRVENNRFTFVNPTLRACWFELNATATTVDIDDLNGQTPRDVRADQVRSIIIDGSYIYNLEANESSVELRSCRVDNSTGRFYIVKDSASSIISDNTSQNNITNTNNIFYRTMQEIGQNNVSNGAWTGRCEFRGTKAPASANLVATQPLNGIDPVSFLGTTTLFTVPVSGGFHGDYIHQMTMPPNYTISSPDAYQPIEGKFYVWTINFRIVSGNVTSKAIAGDSGSLGAILLDPDDDSQWVCAAGIARASGALTPQRIRVSTDSGGCVIEMSEYQLLEFDTSAEAINYYNSKSYQQGG